MNPSPNVTERPGVPDLSIVMPCYNEEEAIRYTIPRLVTAFARAGYSLELVAVDNGSRDRTGEILVELAGKHPGVVPTRVEVNQGYGHGLLHGIGEATGAWVGIIPADGQVDAEDVVRLYEAAVATSLPTLVKARRRFRMDGVTRKVVSVTFNVFFRILWPGVRSIDVNGTPKLVPRESLVAMNLKSKNWLIDAEMMVKSRYLGMRILEHNVFGRMRSNGLSHVRASACWEFFRSLVYHRTTGAWKRDLAEAARRTEVLPRVHV
jgi:glycosyltransferase involved in cell wall biosynthesis